MEVFNLTCISLTLLEYATINKTPPDSLLVPSLALHIISQNIYIWIVVLSSIVEFLAYFFNCYKDYMMFVPLLDEYVVGTILNIIVVTGVLVAKIRYGKKIPKHIQNVIQKLQNLGLFWFIVDKTSQHISFFDTFFLRVGINIFSCYKLFEIQKLMIKK